MALYTYATNTHTHTHTNATNHYTRPTNLPLGRLNSLKTVPSNEDSRRRMGGEVKHDTGANIELSLAVCARCC